MTGVIILHIVKRVKKLGSAKKHLQYAHGWLDLRSMKRALLYLSCMLFLCTSVSAQETLYPVRGKLTGLETMHVELDSRDRDHSRFIAEKTFEYNLMLEYPTKEEAGFLPTSDAKLAMLWIRVENLSKQQININTSSFTLTDEEGHSYTQLAAAEAFQRIINSTLGRRNFLSNTARGISLGRSGATADELKDETMRFAFTSGSVDGQGVKQGLIFFEVPARKKYTVSLRLGDLWSRPFTFTNFKPKN